MGEKGWILQLHPDKSREDCLKLCEELGLIEVVWHGGQDFGGFTQKGHNVMAVMLAMAGYMADDPENLMKVC